jgi:hypothetical protein
VTGGGDLEVSESPNWNATFVVTTDRRQETLDAVKRERGRIDVLYASGGTGEADPLGEITEQDSDATCGFEFERFPLYQGWSQCVQNASSAPRGGTVMFNPGG